MRIWTILNYNNYQQNLLVYSVGILVNEWKYNDTSYWWALLVSYTFGPIKKYSCYRNVIQIFTIDITRNKSKKSDKFKINPRCQINPLLRRSSLQSGCCDLLMYKRSLNTTAEFILCGCYCLQSWHWKCEGIKTKPKTPIYTCTICQKISSMKFLVMIYHHD